MVRITRDDSNLAGFGGVERFVLKQHTVVAVAFYAAMTADTMLVEDRLYFCGEVDLPLLATT